MLESILANNGQYVLSDEEVDAIICGSSLGEVGGVATPLSAGDAVICPDDTANNKWICSNVRTQGGYSYYTLRAVPRNNNSSLFEVHEGGVNTRADWAEFSANLIYEQVLDGALELVNFGLLGTLLSVLEGFDDTTKCDLEYNVNVTSNPKFTFVYDANVDEYFCTLITYSAFIATSISPNIPNTPGSRKDVTVDKTLISPNHTSPSFHAISRFKQGMTWSQVERIGYCSVFFEKGTTKVTLTGFEPPYATVIYTIY